MADLELGAEFIQDIIDTDYEMLRTIGIGAEEVWIRPLDRDHYEANKDAIDNDVLNKRYLPSVKIIGMVTMQLTPEEREKYGVDENTDFMAAFSIREVTEAGLLSINASDPYDFQLDGGLNEDALMVHRGSAYFVERVRQAHHRGAPNFILRVQVFGRKDPASDQYFQDRLRRKMEDG